MYQTPDSTTDYLPVAPHVPAYMADPRWALTESARRAPFAYSRGGAETTLWEHYATPDGALGSAQFGAAMAAQQVDTLPSILHGALRTYGHSAARHSWLLCRFCVE
jgi:hypothetical protein